MKNKNLKFIQNEMVQNGKVITYEKVEKVVKVSDIISQVINVADPKTGYGDLKEQRTRLTILDLCENLDEDVDIEFSDSEKEVLKNCFSTFKPFILSKDLVELQDTINKL